VLVDVWFVQFCEVTPKIAVMHLMADLLHFLSRAWLADFKEFFFQVSDLHGSRASRRIEAHVE